MFHFISANSIHTFRARFNLTLSDSHDPEKVLLMVQEKLVSTHVESAERLRFRGSLGDRAASFEAKMHITDRKVVQLGVHLDQGAQV